MTRSTKIARLEFRSCLLEDSAHETDSAWERSLSRRLAAAPAVAQQNR